MVRRATMAESQHLLSLSAVGPNRAKSSISARFGPFRPAL